MNFLRRQFWRSFIRNTADDWPNREYCFLFQHRRSETFLSKNSHQTYLRKNMLRLHIQKHQRHSSIYVLRSQNYCTDNKFWICLANERKGIIISTMLPRDFILSHATLELRTVNAYLIYTSYFYHYILRYFCRLSEFRCINL